MAWRFKGVIIVVVTKQTQTTLTMSGFKIWLLLLFLLVYTPVAKEKVRCKIGKLSR